MTKHEPFTVIIPAYNEEAVIERCLRSILDSAPEDHKVQIIVAANGCRDKTVEIARSVAPHAITLDITEGSKSAAMNAANKEALHFPRIYLDADVRCNFDTLSALAETLRQSGVMAASPAIRMDLSKSNWLVRAYYRVWLTQPYVTRNMVGSGCFGLSEAGYARIGDFPPITGDDIWVYSRFCQKERRNIDTDLSGQPAFFTVSPPRRAIDQVRVEIRRRLGNEEVRRLYPSEHYNGSNSAGDLWVALRHDATIVDIAIYLLIKAGVRLGAMRAKRKSRSIIWERDHKAREV